MEGKIKLNVKKFIKKHSREEFDLPPSKVHNTKKEYKRNGKHKKDWSVNDEEEEICETCGELISECLCYGDER